MDKHIMTLNSMAITADGTPIGETYKVAIDAITKQKPEAVKEHDKLYELATCPACKNRIVLKIRPAYCYRCGQALKYEGGTK